MTRFTQSRRFGFILLTLTMVGWGLSFSMNRYLLKGTALADEPWGGMSLSVLRFAVALPILLVWSAVILRRRGRLAAGEWAELALMALLAVLGYHLLSNSAQTYASSSLNAVLHQMIPVVAFVGGLVFLREKLSVLKFAGLVVATAGALWYSTAETAVALDSDNVPLAVLLVALVAIDWTLYMIVAKKALRRWSPVEMTVLVNTLGAIMLLAVGELVRPAGLGVSWQLFAEFSVVAWMAMLYVGLVAGIVCYVSFNAGLRIVEGSRAAVFEYLLVPVSMIAALWLPGELHEEPSATKIVAAAIIIAGVYMVTWRKKSPEPETR